MSYSEPRDRDLDLDQNLNFLEMLDPDPYLMDTDRQPQSFVSPMIVRYEDLNPLPVSIVS